MADDSVVGKPVVVEPVVEPVVVEPEPTPHPYGHVPPRWSMFDPPNTEHCLGSAWCAYGNAWNKTPWGKRLPWDAEPWCWVIEFAATATKEGA